MHRFELWGVPKRVPGSPGLKNVTFEYTSTCTIDHFLEGYFFQKILPPPRARAEEFWLAYSEVAWNNVKKLEGNSSPPEVARLGEWRGWERAGGAVGSTARATPPSPPLSSALALWGFLLPLPFPGPTALGGEDTYIGVSQLWVFFSALALGEEYIVVSLNYMFSSYIMYLLRVFWRDTTSILARYIS